MIVEAMTDLIGNTPLLKLDPAVTGLKNIDVYAKLEMMNPFGSVKDRTAWAMIKDDLADIKANDKMIYENSSGNTAKSLQAIAGIHGLKFNLISALLRVTEQKDVLQLMGSSIREVAGVNDCYDPSDPNDPQFLLQRTAKANPGKVYFTSQFENQKNPDYHEETTGQEIVDDLGNVDYFIGGLGTTGSSLGILRKLRSVNEKCVGISVISKRNNFIPGIRTAAQLWDTGLYNKEAYNERIELSVDDVIDGMLTLNRHCGVLCGPSSGANYTAAINHLSAIDGTLTSRKKAVLIVCDRVEHYMSYIREHRPEIFGEPELPNNVYTFDSSSMHNVPEVKAEALESWKQENSSSIIIDIRVADSFSLVNIPGSINMPVELFEKWINGTNPFPSGTAVLLVCAVGLRSHHFAAYLRKLGCNACNLEQGIMAWHDLNKIAA
jgi:S-sulfo-L-cysteine synthase (O-acetyl-L-serine-dependent)